MRKILLTAVLILSALVLMAQLPDSTDTGDTGAEMKANRALAQGFFTTDVYSFDNQFLGNMLVPYSVTDLSNLNVYAQVEREIMVTYIIDTWSGPPEVFQKTIMTDGWYAGGNELLHDLIGSLPPKQVKHLDNPKRRSITILHTGNIREGTILSTKTEGWAKGLVFLK